MDMNRRTLIGTAATAAVVLVGLRYAGADDSARAATYQVTMTPAQWKAKLSPQAYAILREASTEHPGTSPLLEEHRNGIFACRGCDQKLFSSRTKFDSGTGWPSFWQSLPGAVGLSRDRALGYVRTEVHCARCGGHLGHRFDDGPKPTGLRYCMNGAAMTFIPA